MKTKTVTLSFFFILIFYLMPCSMRAQHLAVSGYVVDSKTGEKIEAVNVFEEKSGIGTITDENGYFKLLLWQGPVDVRVSDIKYKPAGAVFPLKSDTTLYIELELKKDIRVNSGNSLPAEHPIVYNLQSSEKKKLKRSGF